MNIWTIYIKTISQNNTYCVNDKSKIDPYVSKCMKEIKKYNKFINDKYIIKWLTDEFAVIYEADENGEKIFPAKTFGEIHRYFVH